MSSHIHDQKSNLASKKVARLNLRSLDALRGFLALYVVAGHCRWLLWEGQSAWSQKPHSLGENILALSSSFLRYGHEAVIVFFVLSGFFIHLRTSKQLAETSTFQFDLIRFIRRRCHRLLPPYAFALVLTVSFDILGSFLYPTLYHAATGDTLIDVNFARKEYSISSVLPAFFLLPNSLGKDFGTNGPLWSLSYEVVYYAIYPLWLLLRKHSALFAYLLGIGVSVFGSHLLPHPFLNNVLSHYPIWLCGAALAELLTRSSQKLQHVYVRLLISSSFVTAFIAINITSLNDMKLFIYSILGASVVLSVLSLPVSLWHSPWHKFLENIGLKSYTIYIFHFPLITLISSWVIETYGTRPTGGWLALSGFLVSLFICNICFYLCEKNFLHARIKVSS